MKKQQRKHFTMRKKNIDTLQSTELLGGARNPRDSRYETYYAECSTYSNWVCK
jgi:hypothetical protein